jgi:uncharacterized phage protein gp47/JayE
MPFSRPSLQTIINRIVADFNNRVDSSQTFLRRSVYKIMGYVFGGAHHLLYGFVEYVKDQLFITTSDVEHLERHGSEYGVLRDSGTKASGNVGIAGTVGTLVPVGSELQDDDGNRYRADANTNIGAGGTASLAITASEVGDDYNKSAGVVLTFVSPIAGVDSNVTVDSDGITSGDDEETDEEYRARVLLRKRYPPHGGIALDYENWALEYGGVTRAWLIEKYYGPGTTGLVFVLDGETDIFPDETTRNAVRNYIISHTDEVLGKDVGIPVTAEPGFFVINAQPKTVNFSIELSPNNGTVQAAVTTNLTEMILQRGGPQQTITISQMYEAITTATGEVKSNIVSPVADVSAAVNEVHVLGDITFGEYNG